MRPASAPWRRRSRGFGTVDGAILVVTGDNAVEVINREDEDLRQIEQAYPGAKTSFQLFWLAQTGGMTERRCSYAQVWGWAISSLRFGRRRRSVDRGHPTKRKKATADFTLFGRMFGTISY